MKKPLACLVVLAAPFALSGAHPARADAPAPAAAAAEGGSPSDGPATPAAPAVPPAPTAAEAGYTYGVNFGQQLNRLGITDQIPLEELMRGLKDGMSGAKQTQPGDLQIVSQYVRSLQSGIIAHNHEAAKQFLERNAIARGVRRTASGLEYKVVAPGDVKAASPKPTDTVTVRYRGRLLDGTEFDSSYARGVPATFQVNGVIKGWQEALPLMKPGAKWQLFVPPELAYDASVRPGIPLGSLLIFDIELVSVAPPVQASQPSRAPPASRGG